MKFAWCTDIHVNFLVTQERETFYDMLKEVDGILISGDIDEAKKIAETMTHMAKYTKKNIYFVLGNHDYYEGSVASVRAEMETICKENPLLHYLTDGNVPVIGNTLITGVDGWADTRYGNVRVSHVVLNDEHYIKDLRNHISNWWYAPNPTAKKWDKRKELADYDADLLLKNTTEAIDNAFVPVKRVIILTHIPPFPEACKHKGQLSDANYLPFYASKATGDVLLTLADKYPEITFSVFCGHTHGSACFQVKPNMCVKAGESVYGVPSIQEIIKI